MDVDVAQLLKSLGPLGVVLVLLWGLYVKERSKAEADRAQLLDFMKQVYQQQVEHEVENVRAKLQLAGTLALIGAAFEKIASERQRAGLDVQREVDEVSERIELFAQQQHSGDLAAQTSEPTTGKSDGDGTKTG